MGETKRRFRAFSRKQSHIISTSYDISIRFSIFLRRNHAGAALDLLNRAAGLEGPAPELPLSSERTIAMKLSIKRTSIIVTTLIAGLVFTAGTASAKEGRGGKAHGQKMFERVDTNKDGKITRAESEKAATARFAKMDANGDGVITLAEAKAAHEARKAKRAEKRAEKAKDKPAREGKSKDDKKARRGHSAEAFFAKADTNKDGKVTRAEAQKMHEARFAKVDANGDGVITKEEAKAAHKAHKKARASKGKQACGEGKKKGEGDKSAPRARSA